MWAQRVWPLFSRHKPTQLCSAHRLQATASVQHHTLLLISEINRLRHQRLLELHDGGLEDPSGLFTRHIYRIFCRKIYCFLRSIYQHWPVYRIFMIQYYCSYVKLIIHPSLLMYLSIHPSIYNQSIRSFFHPSVQLPISIHCVYIHPSIYVFPSICLAIHFSVYNLSVPSIHPSIHFVLFAIHLSVHPFFYL